MVDGAHTFKIADYCIFAATLAISLGIGVYYALSGGRQRTTAEYFVGGRAMNWIPVTISLLVTFESSILLLGFPAEAYVYGIQFIIGSAGFLVANILAACTTPPLFHPLKIVSIYEYLELRYKSKAVHILGSFLGIMTTLLYMGIVLYGPALALDAVTGFPQMGSILLVGLGSTIYTSIGGLKAVIWTDVFQACIMFAGVFAVIIKGTMVAGGPAAVWNIAQEGGRLNFFEFDPDVTVRHNFWNLFFGSILRGLFLGFNQSSMQRIMSQKRLKDARKMLIIVAPAFLITTWLALAEGTVAYAYYTTIRCDPQENKDVANPNQIIVHMVMEVFQWLPGMPGIFLAALFSASLSTLSSGLSSVSSNIWEDFLKPHMPHASELKATIIAKVSVVVCGAISCGLSVLISLIGGTLNQITGSILSAFGSPLSGLFLLSALCPWANKWGAMAGTMVSMIVSCYISFGASFIPLKRQAFELPPAPTDGCRAPFNVTTPYDVTAAYNYVTFGNATAGGVTTPAGHVWGLSATTGTPAQAGPPEAQGIENLLLMSYQWFGPFCILVVFVVGTLVSFLTGANKKDPVEPKYLVPLFDRVLPCLPEGLRRVLRCGVDYPEVKDEEEKETVYDLEMKVSTTNGHSGDKAEFENQEPLLPPAYVPYNHDDLDQAPEVKIQVNAQVKVTMQDDDSCPNKTERE